MQPGLVSVHAVDNDLKEGGERARKEKGKGEEKEKGRRGGGGREKVSPGAPRGATCTGNYRKFQGENTLPDPDPNVGCS